MIWFRRRWPVGVALATLAPLILSLSAGVVSIAAVFNVSYGRRQGVAVSMAGLHQVASVGYSLLWVSQYPFWAVWLWALTENVALVASGLYLRARRQLLESLRERAEQAEAAQHRLADQARHPERAPIAGGMDDVPPPRVAARALPTGGGGGGRAGWAARRGPRTRQAHPVHRPPGPRRAAGCHRGAARRRCRGGCGAAGDAAIPAPTSPGWSRTLAGPG